MDPKFRQEKFITNQSWLRGKRQEDEAEGLWRIHDILYDFSPFIKNHPGGSFWLNQTRGTDITEAFESHHLSEQPIKLLNKYEVRQALKPRNYRYTFDDNGFYRTLKTKVMRNLNTLDYSACVKTDKIHLGLLCTTFGLSILNTFLSYWPLKLIITILAGLSLSWLATVAHNYLHRKDNWQMYTFNLTLMNFAEWRISHAFSHHIYTNSLYDLEMSAYEPFLCWIPSELYASKIRRTISIMIQPFVYTFMFFGSFGLRIAQWILGEISLAVHDFIGFSLPLVMIMCSPNSAMSVLFDWLKILLTGSFIFTLISLNAGHHGPAIYHEGDAKRLNTDWGLYQLDALMDRNDIKGSQFMVLTHFGDHALHHLFPTLDHGLLPQLYPIFWETLKEFKIELREYPFPHHIIEQNRQLLRTKPNLIPPDFETRNGLITQQCNSK